MELRWKWLTRCLIAGAFFAAAQASQADETETDRELLSWTLIAGRAGEPGQLGVKLRGKEEATLDAWLDFDGDGFFNEAEERILDRAAIEPGMSIQTFDLPPAAALHASSRIRFRVDGLDGDTLMEREALAFPERVVDSDCAWVPGFHDSGLNSNVYALEVFDGALYAGGNFTFVDGEITPSWRSARWDGRSWQPLSGFENIDGNVWALESFDDGNGRRLYAGTDFAPYLFRLNGTAWEGIAGIENGVVRALAAWETEEESALYIGGSFQDASGLAGADRVVRWKESEGFEALSNGRPNDVLSLQVFDFGSGSLLYVAAGGSVSRWNGQTWQSLGNPGNPVNSLEQFGATLYAGGGFGVKSWNGINSWATVASLTGNVRSLKVFNDGQGPVLYAGGNSLAAGSSLGKLARWNGSGGWTALARGMNNEIFALEEYLERTGAAPALFAGGSFGQTNSVPSGTNNNLDANFMVRFDAAGFSTLSSGINGYLMTLQADPARNQIYAGGDFNMAGRLAVSNFARWNGRWHDEHGGTPLWPRDILIDPSTSPETIYVASQGDDSGQVRKLQGSQWTNLTFAMDNDARALAIFGGKLHMGGSFDDILPSTGDPQGLAVWNGFTWSPVGANSPIDDEVNALTVFTFGSGPARLVVGGRFSSKVAVWDGSQWSNLAGLTRDVYALAIHDGHDGQGPQLYAAGQGFIARWSGSKGWETFGLVFGQVRALQSFSDGSRQLLAVGGEFSLINFGLYPNFAVWDGEGWNAVGSGFNAMVWALATLPTLEGDRLYAGGEFTTANGLSSAGIARLECPAPTVDFDAAITMTSTSSTMVSIGDQIHYQIEVRNDGPATATNIQVEDVFSGELTGCFWAASGTLGASGQQDGSATTLHQTLTLEPAARVTYDITCTVAPSAEGSLPNVATLNAALDTNPGNDQAQVSHNVLAPVVDFDAAITMTSTPGSGTSVSIGEGIRYRIEVRNNGPATATGLIVEDIFSAKLRDCGWMVQILGGATGQQDGSGITLHQTLTLEPAAQVVYDITCTVAASAEGSLPNIAALTAALDTNPGNDQAQVVHTVLAPVINFDAVITMASTSQIVSTGDPVKYLIEVRNYGPAAATGLKVEDVFPAVLVSCLWTAEGSGASGQQDGSGNALRQTLNLPPNAWVTYDIGCNFAGSNEGILENRASLTPTDLVPANNSALVSHVVQVDGGLAAGDCNGSRTVDALDFDAFHSEIFDGDGAYPEFTPASTFHGDPVGCNANEDGTVDAGDLACLTRKLENLTCPDDPLPATGLPRLAMPDILVIRNRQIEVPVTFQSGQQGINSVAFELHYEPAKIELAAHPDAIRLSELPADAVIYTKVDRQNHLIEVALRLPRERTITVETLVTLTFDVKPAQTAPTVQRGVGFSPRTAASFGNTKGQSVLGLARVRNAVVRTLVVTNSTRLFAQQNGLGFGIDQQRQLNASLEDFLEHARVRGMLIDLATDPDLSELYREWDESGLPAKANEVLFGRPGRRGLHQLLRELERAFDDVDHLLLIGDDRIVPFARLLDDSDPDDDHVTEEDYTNGNVAGGLPDANNSTVKQALAENFFLSDDPLASLENLLLRDVDDQDDFVLPDIGVGRLVENASEILRAFDTFLELDGRLDLQTYDPEDRPVLVAGYDFSSDSAGAIGDLWSTKLGPRAVDSRLLRNEWFAEDLFDAFDQSGARLYSLNGHATHDLIGSPDGQLPFSGLHGLPALDLYGEDHCGNDAGREVDLGGAVVIGMSCHGGLTVPGACEGTSTPAESRTLDLAQTFLARGALAYGDNSGFGWGLLEGIGLGERLAFLIHRRLSGAFLSEAAPNVGTAVRQAKLDYYLQQLEFDEFDRKSLMQWTLYGFPMAELTRPGNLAPPPAPASVFVQREAGDGPLFDLPDHMTRRLGEVQLSAADYHRVELTEDGTDLLDSEPCPVTGCYWQWNGLTTDEVGLPMQPFTIQNTTAVTTIQRGVLWMGGTYEVELPFHPVIATPASSQVATVSSITSLPIRIYQQPTGPNGGGYLGEPEGCPGSSATTSQVVLLTGELRRVSVEPVVWEGRRYRSTAFETLHRSVTAEDCNKPVFGAAPFDYVENGNLHWRVPVSDAGSGVWRVIVVWDDQLAQEWKSVELVRNGGFWEGSLPYDPRRESVTYFLQAVDREGNVAWWERTVDLGLVFRRLLEPVVRHIDPPEATMFADGFESGDCFAWQVNSSNGC